MPLRKFDFVPPVLQRLKVELSRRFLDNGSTGLNQLDLKLINKLEPNKNGYFVELGANDGVRQSNTYKLQRDFAWTGLLIEPCPQRFIECVANRSFANRPEARCAACVPFGYDDTFVEIEYSDLMSVAKGLNVPNEDAVDHADKGSIFLPDCKMRHSYGALARTLTSLLDEVHAPFDFDLLSLDVEGNELAVLHGLDFDRYKPQWILVETRSVEVSDYITAAGYTLSSVLSQNDLYSDQLFSRLTTYC